MDLGTLKVYREQNWQCIIFLSLEILAKKQPSYAGLVHATGDLVVVMDDLQDPPSMLLEMKKTY